jgi:hypothetical protein
MRQPKKHIGLETTFSILVALLRERFVMLLLIVEVVKMWCQTTWWIS